MIVTRELAAGERAALEAHFLVLGTEDRRLRFGLPLSDVGVSDYVESIDFARDVVFGVDDDLALIGAAHLARSEDLAELGISVLPEHRARGIAAALLSRSATHARNWGVGTLLMHCLTENAAMLHLARKQGMQIATTSGGAEACVELPPPSAATVAEAVIAERIALFDHALKTQLLALRQLARPGDKPGDDGGDRESKKGE